MDPEYLITMNSKEDNNVYTGNAHSDIKEKFELKEKLIPTCQEELNSDEIKNESF